MKAIAYALFLLAAVGALGWLWQGLRAGEFRRAFPTHLVGLLGVLSVLCYLPTLRADRAAARASEAVSAVVGEPLTFTCSLNTFVVSGSSGTQGYVEWEAPGRLAKTSGLRYDTCTRLADYIADPEDFRGDVRGRTWALHTITHEAMHMEGERVESIADCRAVQRNALVAEALGASEAAAREIALLYYERYYPDHPYATVECRKGGSLDENLPSSPWNLVGQERIGGR